MSYSASTVLRRYTASKMCSWASVTLRLKFSLPQLYECVGCVENMIVSALVLSKCHKHIFTIQTDIHAVFMCLEGCVVLKSSCMTQTENPCDCVWASLQCLWSQHVTNVSSADRIKQKCKWVTLIILPLVTDVWVQFWWRRKLCKK